MSGWPHRLLARVDANAATARALAHELAALYGDGPYAWLAPGGFRIDDCTLGALDGGLEALLVACTCDRFCIAVDSAHPADRSRAPSEETRQARRRFRVCHEIAHSFFCARERDAVPVRPWPVGARWEEDFCDAFAHAATGLRCPPARLRS